MNKNLFRVFTLLLTVVLVFSVTVPAFASDVSYKQKTSFWSWLASHGDIFQGINAFLGSPGCSVAEDGRHVTSDYIKDLGNGEFECQCSLCGHTYKAYATDAYNEFVNSVQNELNTTYVGNDALYFPLVVSSISGVASTHLSVSAQSTAGAKFNVIFLCDSSGQFIYLYFSNKYFNCPVDGTYSLVLLDSSIPLLYSSSIYSASPYFSSLLENKSYVKGSQITLFSNSYSVQLRNLPSSSSFQSVSGSFYIRCVPFNVSGDVTQNIGGIDNRVTDISGTLGIFDIDGNLDFSFNSPLFSEENNTFYDPKTQNTYDVSGWTYDYSTRSYTLTLDNGDTVTVTYGDENITVNQGGDTYNVYYIIDGTGGGEDPSPSPSTHRHSYRSEVTKEPSCTLTGTRTYTCDECGDTYTETISANGHKWEVKTSVQTEYGEDGSLITEGYTIYKCSVCGEEYKDSDGNGPPGGGSGSSGQADGLFKGIFGIFWDFCSFMLDLFNDFVIDGITGFLDMISDGASGFFDILNPVGWFT